MTTRQLLRLEGAAVFGVATAAFFAFDGAWWVFLLLALAPDLGMVGYLANARVGAWTYNATHVYAAPLVLGAFGATLDSRLPALIAAVWVAHIGADRALGYGLKEPTGFRDTHLGRL
jgi:hypothetical protein